VPELSAQYLVKILLSAVLIATAAEVAKRDVALGALIIALPLLSMLTMGWLWWDTHDEGKIAGFAREILLLVPVSLVFFLPFVFAPRTQFGFYANFLLGLALLAAAVWALRRFSP
jgi:hypothetical protein